MMGFGEAIVWGLLGLLMIYLGARLISAAYFNSKQQYETERNDNGRTHTRP